MSSLGYTIHDYCSILDFLTPPTPSTCHIFYNWRTFKQRRMCSNLVGHEVVMAAHWLCSHHTVQLCWGDWGERQWHCPHTPVQESLPETVTLEWPTHSCQCVMGRQGQICCSTTRENNQLSNNGMLFDNDYPTFISLYSFNRIKQSSILVWE